MTYKITLERVRITKDPHIRHKMQTQVRNEQPIVKLRLG